VKNPRLIETLLALSLIAPVAVATDLATSDRAGAAQLAAGTCAACHGSKGTSETPMFPKLAGQTAAYIKRQLKDFRSHDRADPDAVAFMWAIAAALNDEQIDGLADYFSSQPVPTASGGGSSLPTRGKTIFENGLADAKVPACQSCHGDDGGGMDDFPRLAGQHREYSVKQLQAFQHNLRRGATMGKFAGRLTEEDMEAVAAYIETL
jgi:cbb3-type cytochrome c oxidase subunit III